MGVPCSQSWKTWEFNYKMDMYELTRIENIIVFFTCVYYIWLMFAVLSYCAIYVDIMR